VIWGFHSTVSQHTEISNHTHGEITLHTFLGLPSKLSHNMHNKLPTKTVSYARRFFKTSVPNNAHGTFQEISQLWPILCSPVGIFSFNPQVWELWACPKN